MQCSHTIVLFVGKSCNIIPSSGVMRDAGVMMLAKALPLGSLCIFEGTINFSILMITLGVILELTFIVKGYH